MSSDIIIIGASRGPGRQLFDQLKLTGRPVVGIARKQRGLIVSASAKFVTCDASNSQALAALIGQGNTLVNTSRPEFLTNLLKHKPSVARLVALGSTRVFTRFPDQKCENLNAMKQAISTQNIPTTILHPTMIYGSEGLNNIERIVKVARLSPLIPLPASGNALIQPVHVNDVVACILACLEKTDTIGQTLIVAGRSPITYRELVETCIEFTGSRCRVVSLPYFMLSIIGMLTNIIPGIPSISQNEIRRLLEDKAFDVVKLEQQLGIRPLSVREGLRQLLT